MQPPKATPLYKVALQQLQLRDLLQAAGVPPTVSPSQRRVLLERMRVERGQSLYELCVSIDYTMRVLRTVARDLRLAFYKRPEADALCAKAEEDFARAKGVPLTACPERSFEDVILREPSTENQEAGGGGEGRRREEWENRKAWHANKTLNMKLYDDDFGPSPPDLATFPLVMRAPYLSAVALSSLAPLSPLSTDPANVFPFY